MSPCVELDDKRKKEFEELKKLIRSIVIPYQNGIKIGTLQRDFEEIEGRQLPFKEYGYKSPQHMLQDMPDVARFEYNKHAEFVLFPVANEDTIHIQEMVAGQKKAPGPVRRANTSTGRQMTQSLMNRHRSASQFQRPLVPRFRTNSAQLRPFIPHNNNTQFRPQVPNNAQHFFQSANQFPFNQSFVPLSTSNTFNQNQNRFQAPIVKSTPILGRGPSPVNHSQSSSPIPAYVQNNVTIMLNKFLCGLHLKDFPSFYMHDFKSAFNYQAYGFCNLDDCLRSLTNICEVADDGMIYLKKQTTVAVTNPIQFQIVPNIGRVPTRPTITRTTVASNVCNNSAANGAVNVSKTTTTTSVTVSTQQVTVTVSSTTVTTTVSSIVIKPRLSTSTASPRQDFDWDSWLQARDAESEAKKLNNAKSVITNGCGDIKVTLNKSNSNNASTLNDEWDSWHSASNGVSDNGKGQSGTTRDEHLNGTVATTAATRDCDSNSSSAMNSCAGGDSVDATTARKSSFNTKRLTQTLSKLKTRSSITITAPVTPSVPASVTSTVTTTAPKTTTSVVQSRTTTQQATLRRPKSNMSITVANNQSGSSSQRIVTNYGNNCESLINHSTDGQNVEKISTISELRRFASKSDVAKVGEEHWPTSPSMTTPAALTMCAPAGSHSMGNLQRSSAVSGEHKTRMKVEEWIQRNENLKKGNELLIQKAELALKSKDLPQLSSLNTKAIDITEQLPPQVIATFKRMIATHPNGIPATDFLFDYEKETGFEMNPLDWGVPTPIQVFYSLPSIFVITPPDIDNQMQFDGSESDHILYDANNIPDEVQRFLVSSSQRKPRIPAGCQVPKGAPIEEAVQLKILKILQMMTEGILIADFGCIYQINFREDIYPERWRYETFFELFCALSMELPIAVCGGAEPRVSLEPKLFSEWLQLCIRDHRPSAIKTFVDFPEDALLPGDSLPVIEIPTDLIMRDGDKEQASLWVPALITSAINPSSFWIHMSGESYNDALEKLMAELEFYDLPEADRYRVPAEFVVKGLLCVARFSADRSWHRVRITRVHTEATVTVYYVDYGGVGLAHFKDLRLLKREFAVLKQQGIHVSLKGIKPKSETRKVQKWSIESRSKLLEFSDKNYWLACLFYPKISEDKYEVILCDTNGDHDVYVHSHLVEQGVAEEIQKQQAKGEDVVDDKKLLKKSLASSVSVSNLSFSARIKQMAKRSMSTRNLGKQQQQQAEVRKVPETLLELREIEKKMNNMEGFHELENFNFYSQSATTSAVSNLFATQQKLTGKEVILSLGKVNFGDKRVNVFAIDDNIYVLAAQINDLLKDVTVWKHIAETNFDLESLTLRDGDENILKNIKLDNFASPGCLLYLMKGVLHNMKEIHQSKEVNTFKTFFQQYSETFAKCPKRQRIVQTIVRHKLA